MKQTEQLCFRLITANAGVAKYWLKFLLLWILVNKIALGKKKEEKDKLEQVG